MVFLYNLAYLYLYLYRHSLMHIFMTRELIHSSNQHVVTLMRNAHELHNLKYALQHNT